ncbi:MAG TPA: epoxyqueuosine reductase QueH [bacterium]|jgi:predicted adenine nucleotide alpha hydrolase (AANH) superfamily ATPase|nr:epoxyqueuosine reductase QueH [bacterium]HNU89869.1 epoxyqueuosine reductase QueH [bacterium]HPU92000.1 epoxyqueuosine reductase QueH [bacterium]HPX64445.1 epoxyqueuosine reductase QueH [bacterium]HQB26355.1 epoxyqueuosine reductase QueH [bacterium]
MARKQKPRLLLHICCAPCASWAAKCLMSDYEVTLFFYNPNIWPQEEWSKRLAVVEKLAGIYNLPLIIDDSGVEDWLIMASPLSQEPEQGRRCQLCYEWRLRQTATRADQEGYAYFATSLTVSPYKDREAINQAGQLVAKAVKANYVLTNFQENNGYRHSIELSRQYGLYRQKYCGCKFSLSY